MKPKTTLLLAVILSAITAFALTKLTPAPSTTAPQPETAYERVIRTGTLRCGYEYWDGVIMRDEKASKIIGSMTEIMEAWGKATGLKIEWTAQVGWGEVAAALKTNKVDAHCGIWASAKKSKEIAFSHPVAYQSLEAFVRKDDHKFDSDLNTLNDPAVKIVIIEGDNSDFVAQEDFPKAQRLALGTLNGTDSEELMHVMTNKADVTFTVAGLWHQFNKTNPDKIRRLNPDEKLRTFGLTVAVDNADLRLLQTINSGIDEIQNSGTLDKILDKANIDFPDMYIKPLKPFP
jgi:ABC-type amino acid transport substrate-binding protein